MVHVVSFAVSTRDASQLKPTMHDYQTPEFTATVDSGKKADLLFVLMAWVFVVLRILHAAIHVTSNHVGHRDRRK